MKQRLHRAEHPSSLSHLEDSVNGGDNFPRREDRMEVAITSSKPACGLHDTNWSPLQDGKSSNTGNNNTTTVHGPRPTGSREYRRCPSPMISSALRQETRSR